MNAKTPNGIEILNMNNEVVNKQESGEVIDVNDITQASENAANEPATNCKGSRFMEDGLNTPNESSSPTTKELPATEVVGCSALLGDFDEVFVNGQDYLYHSLIRATEGQYSESVELIKKVN